MEGYLKKKSPKMFIGWQKRFFRVTDNGYRLAYYKETGNKLSSEREKELKGAIDIPDIEEIFATKEKEFTIQFKERKFEMQAQSIEERDKWINAIKYLKTHLEKKKPSILPSQGQGNSEIKEESWRAKNLDPSLKNSLDAENEILDRQRFETLVDDYTPILKAKGFLNYFSKLDHDFINSRVCLGYLNKKGNKGITKYRKRFFILITSMSIDPNVSDNKLLSSDQIPPWCEPDTLYYFKYEGPGDDSPYCGSIPIAKCNELFMEGEEESFLFKKIFKFSTHINRALSLEKGYEFRILSKDRTYYFSTEYITEMNKWIVAFQMCKQNLEKNKPKEEISEPKPGKRTTVSSKPGTKIDENSDVTQFKTIKTTAIAKTSKEDLSNTTGKEEKVENTPQGPCKEGYFYKKSSNKLVGWQKRYFVIKEEIFSWFPNNSDLTTPKNTFSVNQVDEITIHKQLKIHIKFIDGPDLKLSFEGELEADKWFHFLKYWDSYYNCNSERRIGRVENNEQVHEEPKIERLSDTKKDNKPVIIRMKEDKGMEIDYRTSTMKTANFNNERGTTFDKDQSLYGAYAMPNDKSGINQSSEPTFNYQTPDEHERKQSLADKFKGLCCVCFVKKKNTDYYANLN